MFLHVRRRKCTENTSAFSTFHVVSPVPSSVTKESEKNFKFKVNLEPSVYSVFNDEITGEYHDITTLEYLMYFINSTVIW